MLTAIYCRLSREDEDKRSENEEKPSESESIQNQKSLLIKYALDKNWDIYNIYCDDDYSGADRNRPAFNRMLQDAQQKKFEIILVKTQSRFTRDMELVEKYIHGRFMEWGIRFVAAVDNTDTAVQGTKKARQISGLINEWYLEDLSENIRAVFDHKRRQGECISGCTPYGYLLDGTSGKKFVVDEEAAIVVRRIFALYLAGSGTPKIARILNNEQIPNPTKHKQELGMRFRNGCQGNDYGLWNTTSLRRMLCDRTYIGDLVQGKSRSKSYKTRGTVPIPKEKWMIAPGHHTPIIEETLFFSVQEMLSNRSKANSVGEIHPFAGRVACADCKGTLHKYNNKKINGAPTSYLRCKLYARHHDLCTGHSIRLDTLESIVLSRLKEHVQQYYTPIGRVPQMHVAKQREEKERSMEIGRLEREIALRTKAVKDLYLDKSRGILEEAQFCALNRDYMDEKRCLEKRLLAAQATAPMQEATVHKAAVIMARMKEIESLNILTRALINLFVLRIEVGEKKSETKTQEVTIAWKF